MNIYIKYFIAWIALLVLAILNGAFRDMGYKKNTGDLLAHQLSTVILVLLFITATAFIVKHYPPVSASQALLLGLSWMALTLGFEFGFGRYRGNSWEKLFADYNIMEGRIWILVPLCLAIAPYIFYKLVYKNG